MIFLFLIIAFGLPSYGYEQSTLSLETALARKFPTDLKKGGGWVFYAANANIRKVDMPRVKSCIPNYDLYQVVLTNFYSRPREVGACLILFDSVRNTIALVQPMWYNNNEPDKSFLGLFIGQKLGTMDSLLTFLMELNQLMQIGSGYNFRLTSYADSLITYDLGYFNGDTYPTGGNATGSTLRYNEDGLWRKIRIDIKDLTIVKYTEINPKSGGDTVVINSTYFPNLFDTIPTDKIPSLIIH
jgi:hypothetical protein